MLAVFFSLLAVGFVAASAQTNAQTAPDADPIYKLSEVDEKPKIKKKPRAKYEDSYLKCGARGLVVLRIVLLKTGEIGDVAVVTTSRCAAFDDNAVRAAKKVKFKPALKNGQAVSVSATVEYSYSVY